MSPKPCIYKCGIILDGWDDDARRYKESGTGYLHTKERCQEAKAKLGRSNDPAHTNDRRDLEGKNDHGNEEYDPRTEILGGKTAPIGYIDHTLKGLSKCKIFTCDSKADTEAEYNKFLAENKDRIKTQGAHDHVTNQGQDEPLRFTIFLYYEELK